MYHQPGTPYFPSSYDPGRSTTSCPYCASLAVKVGSTQYPWRCLASGHQFVIANAFGYSEMIGTGGLKPVQIGKEEGTR